MDGLVIAMARIETIERAEKLRDEAESKLPKFDSDAMGKGIAGLIGGIVKRHMMLESRCGRSDRNG
jgi:hypothetical protein